MRVDVFYARAAPKVRALIDAFTYVGLVLPLTAWLAYGFSHKVITAYETQERSGMSAFNPVIWPFRAVMLAAFVLLFLQGFAELLRCYRVLRHHEKR